MSAVATPWTKSIWFSRALTILEDAYGADFDDAIAAAVRVLTSEIEAHLVSVIEADLFERGRDDVDVGNVSGRILIHITSMTFDSVDKNFQIRGSFDADRLLLQWPLAAISLMAARTG